MTRPLVNDKWRQVKMICPLTSKHTHSHTDWVGSTLCPPSKQASAMFPAVEFPIWVFWFHFTVAFTCQDMCRRTLDVNVSPENVLKKSSYFTELFKNENTCGRNESLLLVAEYGTAVFSTSESKLVFRTFYFASGPNNGFQTLSCKWPVKMTLNWPLGPSS